MDGSGFFSKVRNGGTFPSIYPEGKPEKLRTDPSHIISATRWKKNDKKKIYIFIRVKEIAVICSVLGYKPEIPVNFLNCYSKKFCKDL